MVPSSNASHRCHRRRRHRRPHASPLLQLPRPHGLPTPPRRRNPSFLPSLNANTWRRRHRRPSTHSFDHTLTPALLLLLLLLPLQLLLMFLGVLRGDLGSRHDGAKPGVGEHLVRGGSVFRVFSEKAAHQVLALRRDVADARGLI